MLLSQHLKLNYIILVNSTKPNSTKLNSTKPSAWRNGWTCGSLHQEMLRLKINSIEKTTEEREAAYLRYLGLILHNSKVR